ncbi:MAG TPA: hypothetical protein ENJ70_00410 [Thermoplasmatales archaeon]|nr:hypothetical protein [Thermoplasmatales archaeon]
MRIYSLAMASLYLLAFALVILSIAGKISFVQPSIPLAFSFLVIFGIYLRADMPHLMVASLLSSGIAAIYLLSAGADIMAKILGEDVEITLWDANPLALLLAFLSIMGLWYYHTGEVKNE